ncbi:hypothetical protein QUF84_25300 [Fictibacillus enclensis]|uniref:hypothetical protein n=1 Tax=Fictibacillus enclensis TaxID=1017270 RepID=UPI0025A133B2|nr:hypothetical protein [Fictibacillus enclensis]MDM5340511.1 hypothetical protein [Fictibacillus enclensis]
MSLIERLNGEDEFMLQKDEEIVLESKPSFVDNFFKGKTLRPTLFKKNHLFWDEL